MRTAKLVMPVLLLLASVASAQEDPAPDIETLDLTMALMPENATLPEAVTRVIELPESVGASAADNAGPGLDTANGARPQRESGLEIAEEASEQGRERAQQAREDLGRGPPEWEPPGPPDGPGNLPGDPPGPGGPPESPGPPGN